MPDRDGDDDRAEDDPPERRARPRQRRADAERTTRLLSPEERHGHRPALDGGDEDAGQREHPEEAEPATESPAMRRASRRWCVDAGHLERPGREGVAAGRSRARSRRRRTTPAACRPTNSAGGRSSRRSAARADGTVGGRGTALATGAAGGTSGATRLGRAAGSAPGSGSDGGTSSGSLGHARPRAAGRPPRSSSPSRSTATLPPDSDDRDPLAVADRDPPGQDGRERGGTGRLHDLLQPFDREPQPARIVGSSRSTMSSR